MEINFMCGTVAIDGLMDYYFCYCGELDTFSWFTHNRDSGVHVIKFR